MNELNLTMAEILIGASLSGEQVQAFDKEHDEMLKSAFGDEFVIPHRIIARVLTLNALE